MNRELPILFSGAMVRAILADQKTQTRRVLQPRGFHPFEGDVDDDGWPVAPARASGCLARLPDSYGKVGDRLWVRETWRHEQYGGRRSAGVLYRADMDEESALRWGPFKPSIHMPRWASRITLEVTEVRVQRLQDISDDDIRAEGVSLEGTPESQSPATRRHTAWRWLWDSINGERPGCSWEANPWVWAISFSGAAVERRQEQAPDGGRP